MKQTYARLGIFFLLCSAYTHFLIGFSQNYLHEQTHYTRGFAGYVVYLLVYLFLEVSAHKLSISNIVRWGTLLGALFVTYQTLPVRF